MATSTQTMSIELDNIAPAPADSENVVQASLLRDQSAPDGGYGWVIIFACSTIAFWIIGTTYSWGIIQTALVEQHLSSPSTLSFVGSLTIAMISVLALVNARVIRALGARTTAVWGITLFGVGEILSGFSTRNVGGLFVTSGFVMGLGTRYVIQLLGDIINSKEPID